jgi:hypothetical protein
MKLMEKFFEDRKRLKFISKVLYVQSSPRPYLHIEDPEVLAGFAGYMKSQCFKKNKNSEVFFRGQNRDDQCIPSLFRDIPTITTTDERVMLRYQAYKELVDETSTLYNAYRFKSKDIDPIFQHYGIRTPWIDLVDNIFVAIWFATKQHNVSCTGVAEFLDSMEKFGWIYFFSVDDSTQVYDLRKKHSSLSLRLHVQHGISVTKKVQKWDLENRNFDNQIIGLVRFPNNKKWRLNNYLFSTRFLFPEESFDNTYKYLKMAKFTKLLEKINKKYSLASEELGKIWNFNF